MLPMGGTVRWGPWRQRSLGPIQLTLHFVISKIFANFGGSNQIVGGTGG
jgi:hypothetical protein